MQYSLSNAVLGDARSGDMGDAAVELAQSMEP